MHIQITLQIICWIQGKQSLYVTVFKNEAPWIQNWRHFKKILMTSVCLLHFTKTVQLKTDELLSNLGCHTPTSSNNEWAAAKTREPQRVVCESQVFARAQASSGILVCCFSPLKNVWNEWEAFLHQRECILWKGFDRQGWICSVCCRMARERRQGGTATPGVE